MKAMWERLAAATGIGFFVIAGVRVFVLDYTPPGPGASGKDILVFYAKHADRMRLANMLVVIGMGLLIWFMGSVRQRITLAEGPGGRLASLAFAGGVLTGLLHLVSASGANAIPFDLATLNEQNAVAYHAATRAIHGAMHAPTTVTRAILLTAVAVAALRFRAMPKWFGWMTFVLAGTSALGVFGYIGVGTIWYVGWGLFPTWVLIASIILLVTQSRAAFCSVEVCGSSANAAGVILADMTKVAGSRLGLGTEH